MFKKVWTSVNLSKKEICFLDEISKNCKFSGGRKLRRTSILRALLVAGKRLNIDVNRVKSEKELKERVLVSFKKLN
ncbi:MAG: hypothetical protein PHU91_02715 [Candidatus Omnitrophica bacterium]|nr:hypothetical protein [Candidatus Omnitrophota bacterium]MDD5610774.1 hypothetical protein [Candidatus Omnitrophota bacterium]